ncbi:hypothetical protein RHSIM_Rhsim08G0170000 [Rhododendron simsii]|uniref:TF-B3 domain-containing protein n=1 Tax=Rhododendron simsii TaxID=118357 RepID=A0A834LE36_RHOSS|nr:hypothetical protein RHSIM_Rhsim08G0170000 [Rhododendron simsii]
MQFSKHMDPGKKTTSSGSGSGRGKRPLITSDMAKPSSRVENPNPENSAFFRKELTDSDVWNGYIQIPGKVAEQHFLGGSPNKSYKEKVLKIRDPRDKTWKMELWKFVKYYRITSSSWREFYTENGLEAEDEILFFKYTPHQTSDGINCYFVRFNKRIAAPASGGGTQGGGGESTRKAASEQMKKGSTGSGKTAAGGSGSKAKAGKGLPGSGKTAAGGSGKK